MRDARDLRDLYPTLDPEAMNSAVVNHVLELAVERKRRRTIVGSDGRSTSEPLTFRCPLDLGREISTVMSERGCTRNAAIIHLLWLGVKGRVGAQADLPTPRELFKKPANQQRGDFLEREAADERTERVAELLDIVMAPEPVNKTRGLFAL